MVSIQLISLASREDFSTVNYERKGVVSIQLISLASREAKTLNQPPIRLLVSIQLISLASREWKATCRGGRVRGVPRFPFN